jgi:dGTPase
VSSNGWDLVVEEEADLENLVEAVCLAHDLGHPPFGHNGEVALQNAMKVRSGTLFEGNAQSFRIATYLEPKVFGQTARGTDRWVGLNLTKTTLRSMCKYPYIETRQHLTDKHPKFGVYCDPRDEEYFLWLWDGDPTAATRTLATEILDVADDIAYAVHDFEDGVWARMIPLYALATEQERELTALANKVIERDRERKSPLFGKPEDVWDALDQLLRPLKDEAKALKGLQTVKSQHWVERPFDRTRDSRAHLKNFCSFMIGELIANVTDGGRLRRPSDDVRRELDVLTGMAWVWMIERSDLETKRFAQRRLITEMFDGYWERPEMLPQQGEWKEIADPARVSDAVWQEKARLICDHIAAMTDLYAFGVHSEMYQATQTLVLQM